MINTNFSYDKKNLYNIYIFACVLLLIIIYHKYKNWKKSIKDKNEKYKQSRKSKCKHSHDITQADDDDDIPDDTYLHDHDTEYNPLSDDITLSSDIDHNIFAHNHDVTHDHELKPDRIFLIEKEDHFLVRLSFMLLVIGIIAFIITLQLTKNN